MNKSLLVSFIPTATVKKSSTHFGELGVGAWRLGHNVFIHVTEKPTKEQIENIEKTLL